MTIFPLAEALQLLAISGYRYVRTPAKWRSTLAYLEDLPDEARSVKVLPKHWVEAGDDHYGLFSVDEPMTGDKPLVILRRQAPVEDQSVGRVQIRDFGASGPWIAAVITETKNPDRLLVEIMEPLARTAAAICPEDWSPADEQDFRDVVGQLANCWVDENYCITFDPDCEHSAEVQFYRKNRSGHYDANQEQDQSQK